MTPNPGSPEAVALGCRCPEIDNAHGRGMPYPHGPRFWIQADCNLHNGRCEHGNPPPWYNCEGCRAASHYGWHMSLKGT
jgi:hypothetical protein